MSRIIQIPTDLSKLNLDEGLIIDMSKIGFDTEPKRKAFIYIRNSGINFDLDFSDCNYVEKEEYLKLYMTGSIEVKSKLLATTWLEILSAPKNTVYPSILSGDEIAIFRKQNSELVTLIHKFINSIPLFAMYVFHGNDQPCMDLSEFPVSYESGITLQNFYQLTEFQYFYTLLQPIAEPGTEPEFFNKMFTDKKNEFWMHQILKNTPFVNFLVALFSSPKYGEMIANEIANLLKEGQPK